MSCYLRLLARTYKVPGEAGDRSRTGDLQLGKLTLYQLSYARNVPTESRQRRDLEQATACELLSYARNPPFGLGLSGASLRSEARTSSRRREPSRMGREGLEPPTSAM